MVGSRRFFLSHLELVPKSFRLKNVVRQCTSKSSLNVEIPKRIERGPTDLLRALAQTVKRDPTAFHYKYPDDPFFDSYAPMTKRRMALSIESGRKSARWIVENNPGFFNHKVAEPFTKGFTPKMVYDENSDVAEETLIGVIKEERVSDALVIYNLLCKKGIEVRNDTKQLLLELLCFYNCNEKEDEKELEMKWFRGNKRDMFVKTWKDSGFAESLFESMSSDCPLACSALIQGRLKYNEVNKAVELFNTAREKKLKLPIGVYNAILRHVNNIESSNEMRWRYTEELLHELQRENIQPNLYTLNAILENLQNLRNWSKSKEKAFQTIAEFKNLGIEPSLGSYSHLIRIVYRSKNYKIIRNDGVLLENILKELSFKKLEIQHPNDFSFFNSTMDICALTLKNSYLGNLLNQLLWKNDNLKFIVESYGELKYYTNYFGLIFDGEPIETAMEIYKTLVPVVHAPAAESFNKIISAIQRNEALEFLPTIWKDLKLLKLNTISSLLEEILKMVSLHKSVKDDDEVLTIFEEAAISFCNEMERRDIHVLYESTISNLLIAFVNKQNGKYAFKIFKEVKNREFLFDLDATALKAFCEFCISRKNPQSIVDCLKYGADINCPQIAQMAEIALPHLSTLNEIDLKWVEKLIRKSEEEPTN